MFGRRKRSGERGDEGGEEQARDRDLATTDALAGADGDDLERVSGEQAGATPSASGAGRGWRVDGPFDESEVDDPSDGGRRLFLGSLWLAGQPGVELQLQVDQQSGTVEGVTFLEGDSALELRAFAAPRTTGIWDDVRAELLASLQEQGASAEEGDGPFGTELRAALPAEMPDGQQGFQPLRFLGVDGPRWFLRGVVSGRGAIEPGAAAPLEQVFRDAVVIRGREPMAPRDPLPLTLPPGAVTDPTEEPGASVDGQLTWPAQLNGVAREGGAPEDPDGQAGRG